MRIDPRWEEILSELRARPGRGRVAVLGLAGRGKSTLARWLAGALAEDAPTGRLDADPGQGTIGPPGTVGLGREAGGDEEVLALGFVGGTSPAGHLMETVVAVARLADRADRLGLQRLVLDPPGFLDFPAGHAFHVHVVELIDADHLVVVDGAPLSPVVEPLARRLRPRIHRVPPSPAVVERSRAERSEFRRRRFSESLEGGRTWLLPADVPVQGRDRWSGEELRGRLVGLLDREGFVLEVGAVAGLEDGRPIVLSRPVPPEALASVAIGSARVQT